MEFEFDKEIDALLWQTAKGEITIAEKIPQPEIRISHLDADAIAAFAENALPEKTKNLYTKHFAGCERCRKILSNVIVSNSETVSAAETKKAAFAAPLPWYRKLFVYPNLAYTLGALVLVFSGFVAFVGLQNDSRKTEVSQVAERQPAGKGMSSDGDATAPETNFSNSSSLNSASVANSAPVYSSNSSAMNASTNSAMRNFNSSAPSSKPGISPTQAPTKEEPRRENEAAKNKPPLPENNLAAGNVAEEKQERAKTDKKDAENADEMKPAATLSAKQQSELPAATDRIGSLASAPKAAARKARAVSSETANVGGKTFKRAGEVWTDTAYKGQAATNITRGTSEYKKLDAGLRSIAENISGTVVIVWKEKAYRIQ